MPKNNPPEKRRARQIQAETGRAYYDCLRIARAEIELEQAQRDRDRVAGITDALLAIRFSD